ncbi:MAG TPA: 16S rRNA (adenine(1518)-N(6)/adenine(1519)-N(6))-dimethyltransferase RsmA [Terriglobales bacterium]|nr:16S rRNA (adenine(1518)-N(6)/adenine(1519)-N(6))-dimethyltransferase RsmA [Terriglobales bacterium]
MTRQRLGQHFLADAGWREKIARAIRISPHGTASPAAAKPYCWIEVGGGHGEMTEQLVKSGEPVYCIEIDLRLIPRLRQLSSRFPNLFVVHRDILETDLGSLAGEHRLRVYGNLPYYITSPILHHLFKFSSLIDEIHIVMQLEVALRLAARPGTRDYGYLSVLTQFHSKPCIALKIPPGAFRPPPKVGSALVSLVLPGEGARLAIGDEGRFFDFVKMCFAQKRKTLLNNLRAAADPEEIKTALNTMGLKSGARAEELSIEQFARLYCVLPQKNGPTL